VDTVPVEGLVGPGMDMGDAVACGGHIFRRYMLLAQKYDHQPAKVKVLFCHELLTKFTMMI
jgi:hypothetical protein